MSTAIAKNFQVGADGTPTNNFTIFQPVTPDGTLRIGNGNTGVTTGLVTLNSSGNLGLGVTPSAWGSGNKALDLGAWGGLSGSTNFAGTLLSGNAYRNEAGQWIFKNSSYGASYYAQSAGTHAWNIAAAGTAGNAISFTQAMTLDSSGNLLVGTTSINSGRFNLLGSTSTDTVAIVQTGSGRTYGNWYFQNKDGTGTGYIQWTGTTTSYVTSSDYRLKENIQPMTGALAKVSALKPCTYKWKADGSDGEGFIAHELQEVVPQCVTGEKDAVDAEGNPVYQGIDTSFLVATLTAALQELKADLDATKAELAALKGAA